MTFGTKQFSICFLSLSMLLYLHLAFGDTVQSPTPCVADYEACGTSVIGVTRLPCCHPSFYCYTHGHYFSQCRPKKEKAKEGTSRKSIPMAETVQEAKHNICGIDYGVCAAGTAADSRVNCCNSAFVCVPVPPLYWQCLPKEQTPLHSLAWFAVSVRGREMYTYGSGGHRAIGAKEKLGDAVWGGGRGCVEGVLPNLGSAWPAFDRKVKHILGPGVDVVVRPGVVRVCGEVVNDLGLALAALPEVLRVNRVE